MIKPQKDVGIAIIRIGLALVFLWFGVNQIFLPDNFAGYLPSWAAESSINIILINGIFEVVFGGLLLVGFFTRLSSAILALHLLGIIFSLGYNDIAIRDVGLFIALVGIFIHGPDKYCKGAKNI